MARDRTTSYDGALGRLRSLHLGVKGVSGALGMQRTQATRSLERLKTLSEASWHRGFHIDVVMVAVEAQRLLAHIGCGTKTQELALCWSLSLA